MSSEAVLNALLARPEIQEFGLSGTKFKTHALTRGEIARLETREDIDNLWCEFLQKRVIDEVTITPEWIFDEFDEFEMMVMFTFFRHRQFDIQSARVALSSRVKSASELIAFYQERFSELEQAKPAEQQPTEEPTQEPDGGT